jgi:hypothetical protein
MSSNKATAHLAGAIYFVLVISGMVALLYVPGQLIVAGEIALTVSRIVASESLFRLGILSAMICQVCYVVLPLLLYKLFKPVNQAQAVLMVALVLVSVPISFVSIANNLDVLALLSGVKEANVLSPADVNAQVMLKLATAETQTLAAELFWGLWLFPFGLLVYRSGFLPKVLGAFLMAGCVGYLIDIVSQVMWPASYRASGVSTFVNLPSAIGEIGICLWMLIMGAKETHASTTGDGDGSGQARAHGAAVPSPSP